MRNGTTTTAIQLKTAKAARGAAAERSNLLVRDAAPALQEVVRMKDEAHAQRYSDATLFDPQNDCTAF